MCSLHADNFKIIYIWVFPEAPSNTRVLCYRKIAARNSWQFTLWRLKSWGKIWGRNHHHHLHCSWRTKHRNWSLPKPPKESGNWAHICSLCTVSEPWDPLPLLQGVNHNILKTLFLKQQNIMRVHSLEFEIYLFNSLQMQPRWHS